MKTMKTMIWMKIYNLDEDYIDYGTEAEDSEMYSDYDEDDDWISS